MELDFLYFLQSIHSQSLNAFFIGITRLGDFGSIWLLISMFFLFKKDTRKLGVCLLVTLAFNFILNDGLIKNIVCRSRPCDVDPSVSLLIPRPLGYSFPSGHTSTAFCVVACLFLNKKKKLGIVTLALACLIAFSRMYLFVHYPSDVLAGTVVGLFSGAVIAIFSKYKYNHTCM